MQNKNCRSLKAIKIKKIKFNLLASTLIVGSLGVSACSSLGDKPVPDDKPDVLYNQALANFHTEHYTEASKKFLAIDTQFPYSPWARKALLMSAYSNYKRKDYQEAINNAKRFVELYPGDKEADYARYIIGTSYAEQIPDVTRDQKFSEEAIAAFSELLRLHPRSRYANDAKVKIRYAYEHLAGKEMQIGRYYEERKEYLAALNRFREVISKYPMTMQVEEALYRTVAINLTLGLKREAIASAAILGQNYPSSPWYHAAYKLLKKFP